MDYFLLKNLPEPLLDWYGKHRRILPWREEPTPYRVWISEIMLQQTRVEAALPYFQRFLEVLPTVEDLAEAPEEQLMKLWEGLGYYSRVRNLQKSAKIIVDEYKGEIPHDYGKLLKLPGIGEYTAGAISSIAFGLPEPAVDGNVLRICSRICGDDSDITAAAVKKQYRELLRPLYAGVSAGDFTQALMELGATICLPNGAPLCMDCPTASFCSARGEGEPTKYPVKAEKKPRKIENRTVFIVEQNGKFLLRKRPAKGLLANMWELPNCLQSDEMTLPSAKSCGSAKHIFSHIEWHMEGKWIQLAEHRDAPQGYIWATAKELQETYALPSAFAAFTKQILAKSSEMCYNIENNTQS